MSVEAQRVWERQLDVFSPKGRGSFYFRGASGDVAFWVRQALRTLQPSLWRQIEGLLTSTTLDEQRERYARIEQRLWGPVLRWATRQPLVLTLLGVPRAQRGLIETQYPGGINAYVEDKLRYLLTELPIEDNYFWRVYLYGRYSADCCPNYLRPENFAVLRERADRVRTHTSTLSDFLRRSGDPYDRFVLLDHQDWMAVHAPKALEEEWDLVIRHSADSARVLMRSAGLDIDFVPAFARSRLLPFDSHHWHQRDRVGTYGSVLCAAIRPA
jgi:S-adenosylmethionine-diacylglycerol 3-amino-3-carboxypropyl transferase